MSKIIAIANQKGGVGKTTTSINLATVFAALGNKTLLIDLDPQGNTSTGLGISSESRNNSIYDVLIEKKIKPLNIKETIVPLLSIITSNINLSAAEIELINVKDREYVLKNVLQDLNYDFIIIDCPPSLGLLTVNALTAADSVIIPSQCEFFALEGLSYLLKTIYLVKKNLNRNLYIDGIILTMYDRRNKLSQQVELDVRKYFKYKVFKTIIPRNVKLSEAPSHGKPAIIYDMKCAGSKSYLHLVREILGNE